MARQPARNDPTATRRNHVYFLLVGTGLLFLTGIVITLLCRLVLPLLRHHPARFWLPALWINLALIPVYALVVVPAVLGYFGSRFVNTRGDERAYGGPRFERDGRWVLQSRDSLRAERNENDGEVGEPASSPSSVALSFAARDGVALRAFLVPALPPARGVAVVMVHGLFRGALELETPGAMLRELGADVLLLEMRNHGGSGRVPATFGLREAWDVEAAAAALRARKDTGGHRLVLFGVSLGTVAVSLAAPQIPNLSGLILDAPVADLLATAHRMLARSPEGAPRRLGLPQPFRSLVMTAIEAWSGIDLATIRPLDALARLPPDVRALVIGAGQDDRVPPEETRMVYDALPSPPGLKELWIVPDARHGTVWVSHAEEYRAHLRAFLDRIR